jgi:hypothetical protein
VAGAALQQQQRQQACQYRVASLPLLGMTAAAATVLLVLAQVLWVQH